MKKNLPLIAFALILIIGGYLFYRSPATDKLFIQPTPTPVVEGIKLPDAWSEQTSDSTFLKFEKKVDSGYQPQIAVIKSSLPQDMTESKYIDNLIAGARSAIPSYRILSNKDSKIEAIYYQGKQKINLSQRIYVINNDIYVLTGSYIESQKLSEEINQIFDQIYSEKIN